MTPNRPMGPPAGAGGGAVAGFFGGAGEDDFFTILAGLLSSDEVLVLGGGDWSFLPLAFVCFVLGGALLVFESGSSSLGDLKQPRVTIQFNNFNTNFVRFMIYR